jgi:hypothetical protein
LQESEDKKPYFFVNGGERKPAAEKAGETGEVFSFYNSISACFSWGRPYVISMSLKEKKE